VTRVKRQSTARLAAAALALAGCAREPVSPADTIYYGGSVVTMDGAGTVADAVAVGGGRILAVGTRAAVERAGRAPRTRMVDLRGRTMVPGFVDAAGHLLRAMAATGQPSVASPPGGPVRDPAAIAGQLAGFARAANLRPGELVMGYGYDGALVPAGGTLTRDPLDAALPRNPVIVVHASGRGAVLNSAALRRFGISAATAAPPGGTIARRPGTREPAGPLMEAAWFSVQRQLPPPAPGGEGERLRRVQELYAAAGVTTAQGGAATADEVELLARAAERGALFIDVVAHPAFTELDRVLLRHPALSFGRYQDRLKLGGVSITVDGPPETGAAYLATPYPRGGPYGGDGWRGAPLVTRELLAGAVRRCYDDGLQLYVEASGDAAIDMLLAAHESAAAGSPSADRRTTVIHAQRVRRDQLVKFARYRIVPSFHTEPLFPPGAEPAERAPLRAAVRLGLRPTIHTDRDPLPLAPMPAVWWAATGGEAAGGRLTPEEALRALTLDAARQLFEDGAKGSIEPGKLADLVVLSDNPLTVRPDEIRRIRVLETIKEGKTIYRAPRPRARRTMGVP